MLYVYGGIALVLVFIGGDLWYKNVRIGNLKEQVSTQEVTIKQKDGQLSEYQASNKNLTGKVAEQSTALDVLKTESDARIKAAGIAKVKADTNAAAAEAKVKAMLAAPQPVKGDSCASACMDLRSPL